MNTENQDNIFIIAGEAYEKLQQHHRPLNISESGTYNYIGLLLGTAAGLSVLFTPVALGGETAKAPYLLKSCNTPKYEI